VLQNERCSARSPEDDTTENVVRGALHLDLRGKDLDPMPVLRMTDTRARVDDMFQEKKQTAAKTSIGVFLIVSTKKLR